MNGGGVSFRGHQQPTGIFIEPMYNAWPKSYIIIIINHGTKTKTKNQKKQNKTKQEKQHKKTKKKKKKIMKKKQENVRCFMLICAYADLLI